MTMIQTAVDSSVMTITINRPEKKNAITRNMYQQMADAIDRSVADPDIRAILLTGQGSCFTSGNDISDFADHGDGEHVAETAHFMKSLMECPLPVVAQVHGLAVGIGTTLLLHCDLVFCDRDCRFKLPFIDLGLVPEFASSYLLPKLCGHRKASEWLMLGESFGSEDAVQFGLVNEALEAGQLVEKVQQVLTRLVAKPKAALAHTKALMKPGQYDIQTHMNEELDLFIQSMRSAPAQEAFSAFLQKRPLDLTKFR